MRYERGALAPLFFLRYISRMSITNNTSQNRYELAAEGSLAIADYRIEDSKLVITRVFVPDELRGKGIAAKVMEGVVADAKARGLAIVPVCSYAATYMQRHPQ